MPSDSRAIAIGATFTAEAIQPVMAFWATELALGCEIRFAAYNQLFQELLDPASLFGRNQGFNVALVRLEDWAAAGIEASARLLAQAIREAAPRLRAPLIVAICPARRHSEESARAACLLREATADLGSVHWLLPEEVNALYPVAEAHDPHGDELGHVPYTPVFFAALATAIARRIHALATPPFKAHRARLRRHAVGRHLRRGRAARRHHRCAAPGACSDSCWSAAAPACCWRCAARITKPTWWKPSAPIPRCRCAWRISPPGASIGTPKAPTWRRWRTSWGWAWTASSWWTTTPRNAARRKPPRPPCWRSPCRREAAAIPDFLRHVWAFDRARVTEEDRRRAEMYAQRAERVRAERAAVSLEEFLASLELEVMIAPMAPADRTRVAQLTQRTNQMNTTLARRTEAEICTLDAECWTVRVRDRFGDYGLTGVVIFRASGDALVVDTFLLSCRALGRGVEHRMVAQLGEAARERGLARVEIPFVAGQRNRPAELFLQSIGGGI